MGKNDEIGDGIMPGILLAIGLIFLLLLIISLADLDSAITKSKNEEKEFCESKGMFFIKEMSNTHKGEITCAEIKNSRIIETREFIKLSGHWIEK